MPRGNLYADEGAARITRSSSLLRHTLAELGGTAQVVGRILPAPDVAERLDSVKRSAR
jgi:hypothetical protein